MEPAAFMRQVRRIQKCGKSSKKLPERRYAGSFLSAENIMKLLYQDPASIKTVVLTDCKNGPEDFIAVVRFGARLEFSEQFCGAIRRNRALVERFLAEDRAVYGVTTGFGENVRYRIPTEDARILQRNIVRSHACAVGKPLSEEQARAVMLMTIFNTGLGHSGISLETLELIRQLLNKNLTPYAPSEGSVGYLSVEAHLAMAYIGEGSFLCGEGKAPADQVLQQAGLQPRVLECKEGLSMLNGTISVTALGLLAAYDAIVTLKNSEIAGALCYEALRGTRKALDQRIHHAKAHAEQWEAAEVMERLLAGSEFCDVNEDKKVQDACLLRAMPQLNGAVRRLVAEAYTVISEEMHSVSDNPEIFATENDDGVALMCGNFDGTFVGSHADMIAMACAIMGTQAEGCIARLVDRNLNDGLPAFLVASPGLNSGFMIPQYVAAGLVNELKTLSVPSSVDSIPTCAGQESPVSMAYNAVKKAGESVRKLGYVVAIEIMAALQAIDMMPQYKQAPATAAIHDAVRKTVLFAGEDRFFQPDIERIFDMIRSGELALLAEREIGSML